MIPFVGFAPRQAEKLCFSGKPHSTPAAVPPSFVYHMSGGIAAENYRDRRRSTASPLGEWRSPQIISAAFTRLSRRADSHVPLGRGRVGADFERAF